MPDESEKSRRIQRVEKELRQIISAYLVREQSGSSEDIVTLTNLIVSPDLRHAKVYVAVIGSDKVSDETLASTQSHAYNIQKEISGQVRMKFCPKVTFYADESIALFAKIDTLKKDDKF